MPSKYYNRGFVQDGYYHIYNRGVVRQDIFRDSNDYAIFLDILRYYLQFLIKNKFQLSERSELSKDRIFSYNTSFAISAFCLMPNHFHLLIWQKAEPTGSTGISNFMRRLLIAYAMYFNEKYKRTGTVFEKYKNVTVTTDEQLLHLIRYIHRNPIPILDAKPLESYPYSSYQTYLGFHSFDWVLFPPALGPIDVKRYREFADETAMNTSLLSTIRIDL